MQTRGTSRRLFGRATRTAAAIVAAIMLAAVGDARGPDTRMSLAAAPMPPSTPIDVRVYEACAALLRFPPINPVISAYVAGFANAEKLDSAATVGYPDLGLAASLGTDEGLRAAGQTTVDGAQYSCNWAKLQLDYQGRREFPPMRATFVTFGLVPVTATVHLVQVGPAERSACLAPDGSTSPDCTPVTTVTYKYQGQVGALTPSYPFYKVVSTADVTMRLSDVTVNGVALDVGDSCRTIAPLTTPDSPIAPDRLVLTGGSFPGDPLPLFGAITNGGALAGNVTIPPFSGCGADGEDLDPLLTATVSGPGNYVKVVQAPLCADLNNRNQCDPDGRPTNFPLWTVTNGGPYTASAAVTFRAGLPTVVITCDSTVAGTMPDTTGPMRSGVASFVWTRLDGCVAANGSRWSVKQVAQATFDPVLHRADGSTLGHLGNMMLELTRTSGVECTLEVAGEQLATYANPPGATLTLGPGNGTAMFIVGNNGCADIRNVNFTTAATYELDPSDITLSSP